MVEINDRIMAEYAIARYRQGYDYMAIYLASVLFERVIYKKIGYIDKSIYLGNTSDEENKTLHELLETIKDHLIEGNLIRENLFTFPDFFKATDNNKTINKLFEYKKMRNRIIHSDCEIEPDCHDTVKQLDLLLYVLAESSPETFASRFENMDTFSTQGLNDILDEISADYMVRAVDETLIHRYDRIMTPVREATYFNSKITIDDFNNLFEMRRKLVALKHDLQFWLDDEDRRGITTTVLTTIDTTSGYIWMPLIHKVYCCESDGRPNLNHATAAILATPLDFRIYIDFGGLCKDDRLKYYDFIGEENGAFIKYVNRIDPRDRKIFKVFDVEWYSSITKSFSANDILRDPLKFKDSVSKAKQFVSEYSGTIITNNKMLSGFVFDRSWVEKKGELPTQLIFEKLRSIIDLYYDLLLS